MRLLIVEDNTENRESLVDILKHEGWAVDAAADGERGLFLAQTNRYDALLLDNFLPKKNGRDICQHLRTEGSSTPVMILSVRNDPAEKAELLDIGADDYLVKPFSSQELLARLRALWRRPALVIPDILTLGDLQLDTHRNELQRGRRLIHLTPKEFSLLEVLLRHKGHVVSRGMIMEAVWNIDADPFSKTIETHILNLRRKIETKGRRYIVSVPGRGYKTTDTTYT